MQTQSLRPGSHTVLLSHPTLRGACRTPHILLPRCHPCLAGISLTVRRDGVPGPKKSHCCYRKTSRNSLMSSASPKDACSHIHTVCGCRTGADLWHADASPHPLTQAGCLGRQVQVCSSAKDPERNAQAVPSSQPWQMFLVSQQEAPDLDFYSWKERCERVLAVSPCHNLLHLHLQKEIRQLFCSGECSSSHTILFGGQPFECKKQVKESRGEGVRQQAVLCTRTLSG